MRALILCRILVENPEVELEFGNLSLYERIM
jgi:hypothetical protein